jgi:hypothetical protein
MVQQKQSRTAVVRRRKIVVAVALVAVAAVAVLTAFVWPGFALDDEPEPTVTVTAPPPTPTAEPAALPEGATEFLSAMPDAALQLVRQDAAEDSAWIDDSGAVEAWAVTYTDGSADGARVDLVAGQWADAEAAAEIYDTLVGAAGEPTASGDVTVGGEPVGGYAVTPEGGAGTSVVIWRNGTAVFRATGPDQLVQDFYQTFPM